MFRLLDKIVATELVSPTIQSKVLPYVQQHGLKLDEVLLQYVKVGWEYEKGGCGLVPGLHQLENKAGWGLETRLGGKWWPRWITLPPQVNIALALASPCPSSSTNPTANHHKSCVHCKEGGGGGGE